MFNLIFSQVYPGGVAIVSTAFNMALPKLYAVSMMWTLNARRTIRASHSSRNGMTNTTSNEISGGRSRAQRRANVRTSFCLSSKIVFADSRMTG
jgi:hypothetical protein